MKLALDRLDRHLKTALAPVYLVAGDEPLQREETADAIRAAARAHGYSDREVFLVERGFDWSGFAMARVSLSLFASKRILEVRLDGKPGDAGAQALMACADSPVPDTLLLVVSTRLDRGGGRWAQALERTGVMVTVWPVEAKQLPAWLGRRLRSRGLQPTEAAVQRIADRVEGNLLAAAQEVEKLLLLHGPGPLDREAVEDAVVDSARFNPYALVDAAVAGDRLRTARILMGLKEEGTEPTLILWALTREIRSLATLAWDIARGIPTERVLAGVWDQRRIPVQRALGRLKPGDGRRLLATAARADRVLKGQAPGRPWDELLNLSEALAGLGLSDAQET